MRGHALEGSRDSNHVQSKTQVRFGILIGAFEDPPGGGRLVPGADQGFGEGGPQFLRLKVGNLAKWSHASEASNLWLGSRAH